MHGIPGAYREFAVWRCSPDTAVRSAAAAPPRPFPAPRRRRLFALCMGLGMSLGMSLQRTPTGIPDGSNGDIRTDLKWAPDPNSPNLRP